MAKFSIVLLRPEIPHNTGAIGRLAVGLGVKLNLIRPLGFHLDSESIRRAGLDYWEHLDVAVHDTWEDYLAAERPQRFFFLSTHGERSLYDSKPADVGMALALNEEFDLPTFFNAVVIVEKQRIGRFKKFIECKRMDIEQVDHADRI